MYHLIFLVLLPLVFAGPVGPFHKSGPTKISTSAEVPLVTFDGEESTTFKFHALNDPVMVSF